MGAADKAEVRRAALAEGRGVAVRDRKTKTFDCVEWKDRAQERLWAEYEARKGEFASEVEFLNAKAEESEIGKVIRAKIARAKAAAEAKG